MFEDVDGPDQTNLIRALVIVGIGLPIIIEVATFGGMMSHYVTGGPSDAGDGGAPPTETAAIEGADVGEKILEETPISATIERGTVVTTDDGWQFLLTIAVSNPGPPPRELRVGAVTTRSGTTVDGAGTTGKIEADTSASVTGSWLLPSGQRPDSVSVSLVTNSDDGVTEAANYTVTLGDIPVSNDR